MRQPRLSSVVERRLLVNYRVAPDAAVRLLPEPLRPQLVHGHAVAGICLLRLGSVRPVGAPRAFGLRSENAAHRIAVEWDGPDGVETGVYIPRRDTASRLNVWAGGRVFPGEHGRADFEVHETPDQVRVAFATRDGDTRVDVTVEPSDELRGSELFADLAEASRFFKAGRRGTRPPGPAATWTAWNCTPTPGTWKPAGFAPPRRPSSTTWTGSRQGAQPWTAPWSCATSPPVGGRSRPWPPTAALDSPGWRPRDAESVRPSGG